ncbi:unnamed protein product [Heterobilharzia americana]|nr:unnamed protein product [Heterobilharzia americana]
MGRPLQEALESTTTCTSSRNTTCSRRTTSEHKSSNKNGSPERHKATEMQESSRFRWGPARSTESRRRDNSGHAHITIAEGVEGREATWRLEEGLLRQTPEEGRPQCLQELANNHSPVHPEQAKY